MVAEKTIFNYVATYNDFERSFAAFLDGAGDVARFAALGTTEQRNSGTTFRIDYLKPNGAVGFYYPDWVVVQKVEGGEVNWIVETKGRVLGRHRRKGRRSAGLVQAGKRSHRKALEVHAHQPSRVYHRAPDVRRVHLEKST